MDTKRLQQIVMEERYNRKEVRSRITKYLNADTAFQAKIKEAEDAVIQWSFTQFGYKSKEDRITYLLNNSMSIHDVIIEIMISIMISSYSNIQTVCGRIAPLLQYEDIFDGVRTVAEVVTVIGIECDLYDIVLPEDSESGSISIESNYEFSEEIHQYLAHIKYLPPMLIKPKKVTHNYDFDYYTVASSKILGSANHHDNPIGLDVLNMLNGVHLELDLFTLAQKELPNKKFDSVEKLIQFDRMVIASEAVYEEILKYGDGKFYLTWKYDKRGRAYSQG